MCISRRHGCFSSYCSIPIPQKNYINFHVRSLSQHKSECTMKKLDGKMLGQLAFTLIQFMLSRPRQDHPNWYAHIKLKTELHQPCKVSKILLKLSMLAKAVSMIMQSFQGLPVLEKKPRPSWPKQLTDQFTILVSDFFF